MRSANDLVRCPICQQVVQSGGLWGHMLFGPHPVEAFRWSYAAITPQQRQEAWLIGTLVGIATLFFIIVLVLR